VRETPFERVEKVHDNAGVLHEEAKCGGLSRRFACAGGLGEDDDVDESNHEEDGVLNEVGQRCQLSGVCCALQLHTMLLSILIHQSDLQQYQA